MIPVVTQPCFDTTMIPLGIVTAEVPYGVSNLDDIHALLGNLASKAPEGCVGLYNFHYQGFDNGSRWVLRGYADAFRKPAGKRCP